MLYGGLDATVWRARLGEKSLVLRLTALRALSGMAEVGARALLTGPSFQEPDLGYPWVWALCRCVDPGILRILRLSGHPSQSLLARARFLLQRQARPKREWKVRRSRSRCLEAMAASEHPQQTLAWAVQLLEMHGDHAIPPLLELIRMHPPGREELFYEKAECAAWALGRLGRICQSEVLAEYRHASARVRRHLAMALWYLGKSADKAVPLLVADKSRQAHAALVAQEERGSQAMLAARRGPVWLDAEAVESLAGIAFSDGDRQFAAGCLGGFGPACGQTLPILNYLAQDPDESVRHTLVRGLGWGGRPETIPLLTQLRNFDASRQVRDRAQAALESFHSWRLASREALLKMAMEGDEAALGQLAEVGLPECEADLNSFMRRLSDGQLALLLVALARTRPFPSVEAGLLLQNLAQGPPAVRSAAAGCLRHVEQTSEVVRGWRRALCDEDGKVVEAAARALGQLRRGLKELGLTAGDLKKLPSRALAALLAEVDPTLLTPDDLLTLLKRPESEPRAAAATALGLLGKPHKRVVQALVKGLDDPQVRLSHARALLNLGQLHYAWYLLFSQSPGDHQRALQALDQLPEVPGGLLDEFRRGQLVNEKVIAWLSTRLQPADFLNLVDEALPGLGLPQAQLLARAIVAKGLAGLDRLPQWLGHPVASVRAAALEALHTFFKVPLEVYQEWLAERGLVLPLRQDNTSPRLPEIVLDFLGLCRAWVIPRLTPILAELAHCHHAPVAAQAVSMLGRAYTAHGHPLAAQAVMSAFHHPGPAVRAAALRAASSTLPVEFWGQDPAPYRESHLLQRAADYIQFGLDRARLLEGLLWLHSLESEVELFQPQRSEHVRVLVSLLDTPLGCAQRVMRLLWNYTGPLDLGTWRAILRAAANPETRPLHAELARRWPRLVVSALAYRADGLDWVAGLESAADKGLALALEHRSRHLRNRALLAMDHRPGQAIRQRLLRLFHSDPCPQVRTRAAGILESWRQPG